MFAIGVVVFGGILILLWVLALTKDRRFGWSALATVVVAALMLPGLYMIDREWRTAALGEVEWLSSSQMASTSHMESVLVLSIDGKEVIIDCMVGNHCGSVRPQPGDYVWVGCRVALLPLTYERSECRVEVLDWVTDLDDEPEPESEAPIGFPVI